MRFDVVTSVGIKRHVFWDMTTCGSVDRHSYKKGEESRALALGIQR